MFYPGRFNSSRNPSTLNPKLSTVLRYLPGVAGGEELVEVAFAALGGHSFDLIVDHRIVHRRLDGAEDADWFGEAIFVTHAAEKVCEAWLESLFVVEQQIVFADAFAQLDDFRIHAVEADAFVAVLAEDE